MEMDIYETELKSIIHNLDKQLQATSESSTHDFHNTLIELIANNNDSKEIIQFIVTVNDKIETKQELIKDIFSDSLKEIIDIKIKVYKHIYNELKQLSTRKPSKFKGVLSVTQKFISSPKVYFLLIAIILITIAFILMPDKVILMFKMYLTGGPV